MHTKYNITHRLKELQTVEKDFTERNGMSFNLNQNCAFGLGDLWLKTGSWANENLPDKP